MKKILLSRTWRALFLGASLLITLSFGAGPAKAAGSFEWTNLDSDIPGAALWHTPDLVNSWGLVPGPAGNIWVCDNGTGLLTRYDDEIGTPLNSGTDVHFPAIPILSSSANMLINAANALSAPTGIALNHRGVIATGTSHGFVDPNTGTEAWFLMASEDGAVSAYSPIVSGSGKSAKFLFTGTAAKVIDNSLDLSGTLGGAVYKGLALALTGTESLATSGPRVGSLTQRLYVANFRSGNVEVYDKDYQPVQTAGHANLVFTDPTLSGTDAPTLPAGASGWAPFNVKRLAFHVAKPKPHVMRLLFVAFAAQDADKHDDVRGQGAGFVDIFDTDGNFLDRIVDAGPKSSLNAPWGMAFARGAFGQAQAADGKLVPIHDALLVGNFGDGTIHAYSLAQLFLDIQTQSPALELGVLLSPVGQKLRFGGLWGLHFGKHGATPLAIGLDEDEMIEGHDLFFAAGPVGENAGLMGRISPH